MPDALGREGYSQREHRLSQAQSVLLMTVRNDGKMMRKRMKNTQTGRKKWDCRGGENEGVRIDPGQPKSMQEGVTNNTTPKYKVRSKLSTSPS